MGYTYGHLDKRLASGPLSAAHHQYDPETKEVFNFVTNMGRTPSLVAFKVSPSGETTILAEIKQRKLPENLQGDTYNAKKGPFVPTYIHAFWMTKNYIIFPESPLQFTNNGLDILLTGNLTASMRWDEEGPMYLHVVSRHGDGHVTTLPVEPFYTFHTSNAWDTVDEQGNVQLHLDACAFPNGDVAYSVHSFGHPVRPTDEPKVADMTHTKPRGITMPPVYNGLAFGDLKRYTLSWNADSASTSATTLTRNAEFPRFNPLNTLKPYRYVWANQQIMVSDTSCERYNLVKIDLETGKLTKFDKPGYACSEPIFVPRSMVAGEKEEDEGAILSLVNILDPKDPEKDRCILLILDAQTMKEVGRCDVGDFTTTTFHGSFVDQHFENVSMN